MDKLPIEIFIYITSFLNTWQKVECMRVCHFWYRLVRDNNLLERIVIRDYYLHDLLEIVEENEYMGKQLQRLELEDCSVAYSEFGKLPVSFPRLEELVWSKSIFTTELESKEVQEIDKFKQWRNTLRQLTSHGDGHLIHAALHSCHFTKLSSIHVTDYAGAGQNILDSNFITALRNAPALETLWIGSFTLFITQLELLHSNTPNLKNLTFDRVQFDREPRMNEIQERIRPAEKIKSFQIKGDQSRILDDSLFWIEYFSCKYANLEDLILECYIPFCYKLEYVTEADTSAARDRVLLHLLQSLSTRLKSFHIEDIPLSTAALTTLDEKGIKLKSLHLDYLNRPLSTKHLINLVFESQQKDSVETLSVYGLHKNISFDFKSMMRLRSLILTFALYVNEKHILLDDLLEKCPPQLESFEIKCRSIGISQVTMLLSRSLQTFGIRKLKLSIFGTDNDVLPYIARSCPMLDTLVIHFTPVVCVPTSSKKGNVLHVGLPGHHLNYLELMIPRGCAYCRVKLENQSKFYKLERCIKNPMIKKQITMPHDIEELENSQYIIVECKSLLEFAIYSR
jgi:hypothetical protein